MNMPPLFRNLSVIGRAKHPVVYPKPGDVGPNEAFMQIRTISG